VIHAVRIPWGRTRRRPIVTVGAAVAIVTRMQSTARGCPRDSRVPTAHAMLEAGGETWRNLEVEARRSGGEWSRVQQGAAGCSRVTQDGAGWSRVKQGGSKVQARCKQRCIIGCRVNDRIPIPVAREAISAMRDTD